MGVNFGTVMVFLSLSFGHAFLVVIFWSFFVVFVLDMVLELCLGGCYAYRRHFVLFFFAASLNLARVLA
jgi:hypothetical protein